MADQLNVTTPVGRLVQGSLYEPQVKDMDGKPLVVKNGPDAGKPTQRFYFALAIPKEPGHTHWALTAWGKPIWALGHQSAPVAAQRPDFAWKIEDGDSQVPNKRNRKPCDQEGFPGCWVLRFSSGFAPKVYTLIGQTEPKVLEQRDAINPGDFVQVNFNAAANNDARNPGVYLNHSMVCLIGYGERITFGPDVSQAGFGGVALPPGATTTPQGGFTPPAPAAPAAPAALAYVAPPIAAPAAPPPPIAVAPHTAILNPPPPPAGTAAAPPPPPPAGTAAAPPPPVGPRMTAKAGTATYDDYKKAGWSDAQLKQHGYME